MVKKDDLKVLLFIKSRINLEFKRLDFADYCKIYFKKWWFIVAYRQLAYSLCKLLALTAYIRAIYLYFLAKNKCIEKSFSPVAL